MRVINVLITHVSYQASAGSFIKQLRNSEKFKCFIVGTDSIKKGFSSGSMLIDKFYHVPYDPYQPQYIYEIEKICKRDKIDIVFSAEEEDLIVFKKHNLSQVFPQFIPNKEIFDLFSDKYIASKKLSEKNISVPYTIMNYNDYENSKAVKFIWRKRISCCSRGIKTLVKMDINHDYIFYSNNHITQEFIEGKEYTVDVLCDKAGNPRLIIPRQCLSTKDGTTFKCIIEKEQYLIDVCEKIYADFCIPGLSNIQFIVSNGKAYFIELNPRAAATHIASSLVSINFLDLLINEYLFNIDMPSYDCLMSTIKWNSIISRYYQETVLIGEGK